MPTSNDGYDMTMMLATHNALRRDLDRLAGVAERPGLDDPRRRAGVQRGWTALKSWLHGHHVGEDTSMWPRMRAGLSGRPDDLAVLDVMEDDHRRIDPLIQVVDAALRRPDDNGGRLADSISNFRTEVSAHLFREENEALPLVKVALGPEQWTRCVAEMRGGMVAALRAAPEFFPWLLDEASPAEAAAVLGKVPPPVRLVYEKIWLPRYQRHPRWGL